MKSGGGLALIALAGIGALAMLGRKKTDFSGSGSGSGPDIEPTGPEVEPPETWETAPTGWEIPQIPRVNEGAPTSSPERSAPPSRVNEGGNAAQPQPQSEPANNSLQYGWMDAAKHLAPSVSWSNSPVEATIKDQINGETFTCYPVNRWKFGEWDIHHYVHDAQGLPYPCRKDP